MPEVSSPSPLFADHAPGALTTQTACVSRCSSLQHSPGADLPPRPRAAHAGGCLAPGPLATPRGHDGPAWLGMGSRGSRGPERGTWVPGSLSRNDLGCLQASDPSNPRPRVIPRAETCPQIPVLPQTQPPETPAQGPEGTLRVVSSLSRSLTAVRLQGRGVEPQRCPWVLGG